MSVEVLADSKCPICKSEDVRRTGKRSIKCKSCGSRTGPVVP